MPVNITDKVKNVIKRDKRIMFTSTREHYPFVVDHGSGDFVYDIEGNRFLDFSSFISVYSFGVNANNEIRSAIKKQIDKMMHAAFLDYYAELPVRFAENLVSMMPRGFGRVFFSNSGTEANEDAIKLARLFTKKSYMIGFYNGFHGRSLGSLGLTASSIKQREHLGPFSNVVHALYPYPYRCPFGTDDPEECSKMCISHIERNILGKEFSAKEVAAIFVEPIQGEGGYVVPPVSFMKELRRLADDNGILLVSDEIQSGYMRTGKFLAMENFGVTADIYTLAKALGGGLPAAATIAKSEFGDTPAGSHAGTFGGNLLAMAAGNASLNYVKRNRRKLEGMAKTKGRYVMKRLNKMKEDYEIVGDVRGIGMMIGVELVKSKKTKAPAVDERSAILDACFQNGLLLLPAGVSTIRIIPPLTIEQSHLESGMDVLEEQVRIAAKGKKG